VSDQTPDGVPDSVGPGEGEPASQVVTTSTAVHGVSDGAPDAVADDSSVAADSRPADPDTRSSPPEPIPLVRLVPPVAWVLEVLVLLGSGAVLVTLNRPLWFFMDDWSFLRFPPQPTGLVDEYLHPHNDHWSTAPILLYQGLRTVFGMREHWPYAGLLVTAHLIAVAAMFLLLAQLRVAWPLAVAFTVPLGVLGAGSENLVWDFQIGFVGSVALGTIALFLVARGEGSWRRLALVAAVVTVSLTFSGVSLAYVVAVVLGVLGRFGLRRALATAAVPVAVYVTWYLGYGDRFTHPVSITAPGEVSRLARYVGAMGVSATERFLDPAGVHVTALAVALGAAVLLTAVVHIRSPRAVALAGLLGAAAFGVSVGLNRDNGPHALIAPRYVYVVIFLATPALAVLVAALCERAGPLSTPLVVGAAAGIAVAVGGHNLRLLVSDAHARVALTRPATDTFLGASTLLAHGEPFLPGAVPEPHYTFGVSAIGLQRLLRAGLMPTPTASEADQLAARLTLQVGLVDHPVGAVAPEVLCVGRPGGEDIPVRLTVGSWRLVGPPNARLQLSAVTASGLASTRSVLRAGYPYVANIVTDPTIAVTIGAPTGISLCAG